jgi:hypothetical protein
LSGLENRALQDGPFSWDYTTQISVFDWGGRVGGKLDFIDSPRRHEVFTPVSRKNVDFLNIKL